MIVSNSVFNIGQPEYTIHFWFKPDNTTQDTRCMFNTIPHTGISINFNVNNTSYLNYFIGPANAYWTSSYRHGPKHDYVAGQWYASTMTKSGTTYSFYVDGQLEDSIVIAAAANYNYDVQFRLSGIDTVNQIFAGDLDDVRIYSRSLSASEVLQLFQYNEGLLAPTITAHPQGVSTTAGGEATFSVTASGAAPLSYQWRKDALTLPGATGSSLTFTNVQPPRIGDYTVVITNASGSVTSSVASLSIPDVDSAIWKNLVAYYPFNGNANDASGNRNNGTVTGPVLAPDRFGTPDSAYLLNGTSGYIVVPNAPANNLSPEFTISFWMKPNPGYGTPFWGNIPIVCKWGDGGVGLASYSVGVTSSGKLFLATCDPTTTTQVDDTSVTTTGVWHQVQLVRDGTGFHLYRDNTLLFSTNTLVQPQPSVYNLNFGGGDVNDQAYYGGSLDDVRIYNRALSSAEVARLYASEAPAPPAITQQPAGRVANQGDSVTFEVRANSTLTLTYQWQKDGLTLPGATGSSLTFTNVQPPRIGDYTVVITNASGSVTSSVASLSISNINSALWKNLVAYYPFNGNANDESDNRNSGAIHGATLVSDRFGGQGLAMEFDGVSHYISAPHQPYLNFPSGDFTVSFWAALNDLSRVQYLIGKDMGQGIQNKWIVTYMSPVGFGLFINGPGVAFADLKPQVNTWHQFVFRKSGSDYSFCFDGSLASSGPGASSLRPDNTAPLTIGWAEGPAFFGGKMDDIRIYGRALSSDEVSQLYTSEAPTAPSITRQPVSQVTNQGGVVAFDVGAASNGVLTYQWRKNGGDLVGATDSILTLSSVQPSDAGNYTVVVGAGGQTVTSAVARLDVIHRATATPIVNFGFVVGGTVLGGGFGYTNTPLVHIVGGGGSGAVATAIVSNGVVTGIRMLNAGFDYTSTPLMIIQPPFIPSPSLAVSPMTELTSAELAQGGNYQLQRKMVWFWTNEMPSFQATSSSITQLVAGIAGTATYRLVLSPTPSQAFATPEMVHGFVVGVTINAGGSGYVTTPRVVIYGGGGTNATAVASLTGGVVTGIAITSAGIGYTSAPSIRIDPPPAASVTPQQTQVLRLKSANLSPYDTYRFEATPAVGSGWQAIGSAVVPTESTNTTDVTVTNSAGFLRLKYVP